jgi:hypothetical protein
MFLRNKQETSVKYVVSRDMLAICFTLVSWSAYSSALKMEAIYCSETSIDLQRTTWLYLHNHRCENLKYYIFVQKAFSASLPTRRVTAWFVRPIGSTRHVGHQLAYCTCPWWLWGWRIWWNDDCQGKPKYSQKTCPSATCLPQFPHNLTGHEPGPPRGEASD